MLPRDISSISAVSKRARAGTTGDDLMAFY
jgi:hypothetical protein